MQQIKTEKYFLESMKKQEELVIIEKQSNKNSLSVVIWCIAPNVTLA